MAKRRSTVWASANSCRVPNTRACSNHSGSGTSTYVYIDEKASEEQRQALKEMAGISSGGSQNA